MTCPFCGEPGEGCLVGRDVVAIRFCPACNIVFSGMPDNVGKWTRHPVFGDPWRCDRLRLPVPRSS